MAEKRLYNKDIEYPGSIYEINEQNVLCTSPKRSSYPPTVSYDNTAKRAKSKTPLPSHPLDVFEFAALIRLLHRDGLGLLINTTTPTAIQISRGIDAAPLIHQYLPEHVQQLIRDYRLAILGTIRLFCTRPPSDEWQNTVNRLGIRAQVRLLARRGYLIRYQVWTAPFPGSQTPEYVRYITQTLELRRQMEKSVSQKMGQNLAAENAWMADFGPVAPAQTLTSHGAPSR